MMITARIRALLAALSVSFAATAPATAAMVASQAPCVSEAGYCLRFDAEETIPVIRSFNFVAPGPGTAAVRFHGSLNCFNEFFRPAVVDVVSQIVTRTRDIPDASGPGGLRHAIVFAAGSDPLIGGIDRADTFNLRSTRVFSIAEAGVTRFLFKIARLRMDSATSCIVYNAAFSVVFVP